MSQQYLTVGKYLFKNPSFALFFFNCRRFKNIGSKMLLLISEGVC